MTSAAPPTVVRVPLIQLNYSIHLRWGEWLAVVLTASLAMAIAIEVLLASLATAWFGDPSQALLPLPSIFAVIFVAALIGRIIEIMPILQRAGFILTGLGFAATALILIHQQVFPTESDLGWLASLGALLDLNSVPEHTEVGLIILSGLLWVLGTRLNMRSGEYDARRGSFWGFFTLIVASVIIGELAPAGRNALGEQIGLALPAYLFIGLIMLSQIRLAEVRSRLSLSGKRAVQRWNLTTLMITIAATLLVFIGLALTFTNAYIQAVLGALAAIRAGLYIILSAVAVIISFILPYLVNLFQALHLTPATPRSAPTCTPSPTAGTTATPTGASTTSCAQSILSKLGSQQTAPINGYLVYGFIVLVAIAIVVLLVLRAGRARKSGQTEDEFEETREHLPRRIPRRDAVPQPAVALAAIDLPAPDTVRAAYRELLQVSATAGFPREANETADEFGDRLAREAESAELREVVEATQSLTQDYDEERYGQLQPDTGILARARRALSAIVQALRPRPALRDRRTRRQQR
jgi:hypothetical protein